MFFKKKNRQKVSEIIAASKFPDDLHHLLETQSITIAISSSETTVNVKCDSSNPDVLVIDTGTRYIGVVHLHHFRESVVPVLLSTSSTRAFGDIGSLSVHREQSEASVKSRFEVFGEHIDPVYDFYVWLRDDDDKIKSLIQIGLENCVKDGRRFLHIEFSLQPCNPDEALAKLASSEQITLPILALNMVDELTLPRAPVWSHRWWYK